MKPDNDNTPRTPAEHRATVAALAANLPQHAPRARKGWPTAGRLRKDKALGHLIALERFARDEGIDVNDGFAAANDNNPADDTGRAEISRVDSLMDDGPNGDEIAAAAKSDERDRKEGRPEKATRIKFGAHGRIISVEVRGRHRPMVETFATPRGGAGTKVSLGNGYGLPDDLPAPSAEDWIDHRAMKTRLGAETCRLLELACGDATSEEIGEMHGASGKTAERKGVEMVDAAICRLVAEYARRDAADREAA
jgi:hypothetical protein